MGGVSSPAAAGALGLGNFGPSTGMTPLNGVEGHGSEAATSTNLGVNQRDQDEERRRRIEEIVRMLAGRWGRVSPDGVERCARRVGLEWMWEEEGGKRTLSIAGTGVLIDVEFIGQEVGAVVLSFPFSGDGVGRLAGAGAEVLRGDLKAEGKGYMMLDAFVENLESLARMDRLGGGGLSCFDAVEGVYSSLKRVFEWELGRLRDERGVNHGEEWLSREVMCKSSGRPRMHVTSRVGFALSYWQERRLVPGRKRKAVKMKDGFDGSNSRVYSAIIECEASSSDLYPSVRVSDAWVSAQIEKPPSLDPNPFSLISDPSIDWQEPPPTLLSPEALPGAMVLDSDPLRPRKQPNVRFVAHLDPPVIVPLQAALDVFESVGAPISQDSIQPTSYEALLFADIDQASALQTAHTQNPLKLRTALGTTTSYPSGKPLTHRYKYTLFTHQQAFARSIDHIPFSHPRQLIALLPLLRQWALLGSILRRCFAVPSFSSNASNPDPSTKTNHSSPSEITTTKDQDATEAELTTALANASTLDEELAALLAPPTRAPKPAPPLAVDISLSLSPSPPRLSILFAPDNGAPSGVAVAIGLNGAMGILNGQDQDGVGADRDRDKEKAERARRVLEISESVGVVVAWMGGKEEGEQDE